MSSKKNIASRLDTVCDELSTKIDSVCDESLAEHKKTFDENRYIIFRNFFSPYDVMRMSRRMWFLKLNNLLEIDEQCPLSSSIYSDPVHSEMQELYRIKLEELIGYQLYPTYTYSRIYSPREILKRHRDRPSCQISITATLDYDTINNEPWELIVEPNKGYKLYPGDALVYKGCDIDHWREAFRGYSQTQVFFHYVDANGPYSEFKYDFRPSLGSSVKTKNLKLEQEIIEKLRKNNEDNRK